MTQVATAELLGVNAAARALGVNASTVSRYLRDHPELNCDPDGPKPMIDVEAYRAHRAENTNAARSGSHAGRLFGEGPDSGDGVPAADDDDDGKGERKRKPKDAKKPDVPSYALAKAVREGILAQRAHIELDELRGLLVPRAEVEDQVFDAGQRLQLALLDLGTQVAERLAVMTDAREIAALLESEHRRVLATLAAALRAEEKAHAAA